MNISQKAADALLAILAETGLFTVADRESLDAIQAEKKLKMRLIGHPTIPQDGASLKAAGRERVRSTAN